MIVHTCVNIRIEIYILSLHFMMKNCLAILMSPKSPSGFTDIKIANVSSSSASLKYEFQSLSIRIDTAVVSVPIRCSQLLLSNKMSPNKVASLGDNYPIVHML